MPDYRLSKAAEQDLLAIARYGDEHFGLAQSDHYRDRLKQRFAVLAATPMLYPAIARPPGLNSIQPASTVVRRAPFPVRTLTESDHAA